MFSVVFVQDDQIPLGETKEGGIYPCCEIKMTYTWTNSQSQQFYLLYNRSFCFLFESSLDLTRVETVQQSHHILGPLPQTLEEGHHQIADVFCIVGGERVLVSFDGGQGKTLALEFTPSGK